MIKSSLNGKINLKRGSVMAGQIKICSFNLRCDVAVDGINQFSKGRCNRVLELIANEAPDVIS
jgi:hypothetical protein